ncbi:PilZ domain-containing protein [Sphingomonas guangdongensis]|uniref:PilZ domain-containing protein n=1 Tax=Sphingomonas guangdongensis TaxID=1141890 RepID=UPI000BE359CA|nr:PilZ domain-containing protein [Sphingomonas guangdongensis]
MRTREDRTNVLLDARMRAGSSWLSASIRNVSSRGAMLALPHPPPVGTYVELRRGDMIIIARVVWSDEQRCGLRSQRPISLPHLQAANPHRELYRPDSPRERRAQPRDGVEIGLTRSINFGRKLEFLAVALFAGLLAISAGKMAFDVLAQPFSTATRAMDRCFEQPGCSS